MLPWLPSQCSFQGLWWALCLHPVQWLMCMKEEDQLIGIRTWNWVCLSCPPKLEGVCYTFEMYSFISPQTFWCCFSFTYCLKFWAFNILTSNRHWLMSNGSQNVFLGSTLLFWQLWPQVNIYAHIYKGIYIHISTCINSAIRTAFYSNHCPMFSTIPYCFWWRKKGRKKKKRKLCS